MDLYKLNFFIHDINNRCGTDLHPSTSIDISSTSDLTFWKGAFNFGIKVFNHLLPTIKNLSHKQQ
jgi:hypothetical protein